MRVTGPETDSMFDIIDNRDKLAALEARKSAEQQPGEKAGLMAMRR